MAETTLAHISTMTLRTAQEACQFLVTHEKSQAAIAARVGLTQPTISRILTGKHDPAGSTLIKLNQFCDEVEAEQPQISATPAT